MAREIHDHYFKEAKREGYLSRAAYKLIEIDDRRNLLKPGCCIVDFGAAPGSWLQVASQRVHPGGHVLGIDLSPITHRFQQENVSHLVGDVLEIEPKVLIAALPPAWQQTRPCDVALSDMAPRTTGDASMDHHGSIALCDRVVCLCAEILAPGGDLVMKVLEGEAFPDLVQRLKEQFGRVKPFKPKASRSESREMYVIATDFVEEPPSEPDAPQAPLPPMPSGWAT